LTTQKGKLGELMLTARGGKTRLGKREPKKKVNQGAKSQCPALVEKKDKANSRSQPRRGNWGPLGLCERKKNNRLDHNQQTRLKTRKEGQSQSILR